MRNLRDHKTKLQNPFHIFRAYINSFGPRFLIQNVLIKMIILTRKDKQEH